MGQEIPLPLQEWIASLPPEQQIIAIAQLQLDQPQEDGDRDLGYQAKLLNYQQDQTYSLADSMQTAQSGAGSYGLGAFDPVAVPGSAPQLMGRQILDRASQSPEWSMEGFIGRLMNGEDPLTGSQAFSAYERGLNSDTEVGDALREFAPPQYEAEVPGSLDTVMKYDLQGAEKFATDLQSALYADPDDTGPEYEQSPQSEFFAKQGLPTPVEQYGQGRYATEQLLGPETAMMANEYEQAAMARRMLDQERSLFEALAPARDQASRNYMESTRRTGAPPPAPAPPAEDGGGSAWGRLVDKAKAGDALGAISETAGVVRDVSSAYYDADNSSQPLGFLFEPGALLNENGERTPDPGFQGGTDYMDFSGKTERPNLERDRQKALDREAEARYALWADPRRRAITQANRFAINSGRTPLDDALANRQMAMFMQTGQGQPPQMPGRPPPLSYRPETRQENNQNWRDKFKPVQNTWGGYKG